MEIFAPYGHALLAIAAVAGMQLLMGPLSALKKLTSGLAPGATPAADYGDSTYRMHRAYANLTESLGTFAAVTVAAMLAGGTPYWVNLFASVFLLMRVVMLLIHVSGAGNPNFSLRTFSFVVGWLMCFGQVYLVVKAVLFGG